MAKMRIYTVHIDPKKNHPYESPIFVEEGFNWMAFIFKGFWALYHRVWSAAIGLFGFDFLISYLDFRFHMHPVSLIALQFGFMAFVAFHANDLRREVLRRRGYTTVDIVTSDNMVGAEQRFFERYFTQPRPALKPAPSLAPAIPL